MLKIWGDSLYFKKSNVDYTRCMTATGFKWLAIRSQEINTGQKELEYFYISLKIHWH